MRKKKAYDYVELDELGVVRIYRTASEAIESPSFGTTNFGRVEHAVAVGQIRRRVLERDNYECVRCGKYVTEVTAEMNEKIPKGRGGEVSLDNCETLCYPCHQGVLGVHGDRRWGGRVKVFRD